MSDVVPATTLRQRIGLLRRRRKLIVYTFLITLVSMLLVAWFWPATYKSTGTILIEQQELPADLVRSTVTSYADQRIQVISQRVMTTENLLKIIDRYDLYTQLRRRETREEVIARMRKDIEFQMISADVYDPRQGRASKANIAFSVSYSNRSPQVAAKVANEIVSLYLQENLDSRKESSENATSFLGEESNKLNVSINELQARLAQFKEQHQDELPELATINLQVMNRTEEDMRDVDTQLRSLDEQITYLQAQLAQLTPVSQMYSSTGERIQAPEDRLKLLKMEYARLSAVYSADHPDVVRTKREIEGLGGRVDSTGATGDSANDLRRQLEESKTQLEDAQKRYEPFHPDVVRLERLVKSLQEAVNAADTQTTSAAAAARAAKLSALNSDAAQPDNPAYIQVKSQLEASNNERTSLQRKRAEIKAKIDDYERRLQKAPAVERDYTAITRDLDSAQLKYREVRDKEMEAQLAQNLESERKGERFSLIEPPLVPEQPASPNRGLIAALGVVLGLVAALGAAALREGMDGTIRGRDELQRLLGVPPLAIIPYLVTKGEQRRSKRRVWLAAAGTVGGLALAVVAVHLLYRPLDVIWAVAMRKLGI